MGNSGNSEICRLIPQLLNSQVPKFSSSPSYHPGMTICPPIDRSSSQEHAIYTDTYPLSTNSYYISIYYIYTIYIIYIDILSVYFGSEPSGGGMTGNLRIWEFAKLRFGG
jgi:hypothetical protein